jgi:hypothetical protein
MPLLDKCVHPITPETAMVIEFDAKYGDVLCDIADGKVSGNNIQNGSSPQLNDVTSF